MNKILPLPVKKNKFGQRVADISVEKYYHQIFEEVLEAHYAASIADYLRDSVHDFYVNNDLINDETEELVDVTTCCITRLDIIHRYKDNFEEYLQKVFTIGGSNYRASDDDFYTDLIQRVSYAYHSAKIEQIIESGCGQFAEDYDFYEDDELENIIFMCIKRLEYLGYDEKKRQELYQAVNEKNRKRGYFDEDFDS